MNEFDDNQDIYTDRFDFKKALMGSLSTDPPLLYELGINLQLIRSESLLPIRVLNAPPGHKFIGEESDLTGPILLSALFTLILVLHGKIHFGYIYLISLCSCASVYAFISLMAPRGINAVTCSSILGYSMGPVVLYAFMALALRWTPPAIQMLVGIFSAVWSAYTAAVVMCTHLEMQQKTAVLGYPLFLMYMCFVLLVIF